MEIITSSSPGNFLASSIMCPQKMCFLFRQYHSSIFSFSLISINKSSFTFLYCNLICDNALIPQEIVSFSRAENGLQCFISTYFLRKILELEYSMLKKWINKLLNKVAIVNNILVRKGLSMIVYILILYATSHKILLLLFLSFVISRRIADV